VPPAGWIWPFDSVQAWFEGLWNWVSEAANAAANYLWGLISPTLNTISTAVAGVASQISTWIGPVLDAVKTAVAGVVSGVAGWLGPVFEPLFAWTLDEVRAFWSGLQAFIKDPVGTLSVAFSSLGKTLMDGLTATGGWISSVGTWIADTIWGWVNGALRWATDTFRWLRDEVSTTGSWIVGQVSTAFDGAVGGIAGALAVLPDMFTSGLSSALSGIWETLLSGFGSMMTGVTSFLQANIVDPIMGGLAWIFDRLRDGVTGFIRSILDLFAGHSPITSEEALNLGIMGAGITAVIGGSLSGIVDAVATKILATGAETRALAQFVNNMVNPEMFIGATLGVVLGIAVRTPLEHYYRKIFRPSVPPVQDAARMFLRGVLSRDDFVDVIGRQGYGAPYEDGYLELAYNIPDPRDLILFVVREVITPEEFYAWMPKQGYSEYWAKAYWGAHWVLPAAMSVVDAYHRGVITSEELNKFLVWHDYSPEPRPGIGKSDVDIMRGLFKRPIPRVDLRRAWELGAISDEDLETRYGYLGYEEDAPLMAEIAKRVSLEAEIGKIRDNAKMDFVRGYITEDAFRATLSGLGYSPLLVEYHFRDAREDQDRKYKDDVIDYYVDAYVKDLLTDEELETRLRDLLVRPEILELQLEKAYVRKYKKPKPATVEKVPVLTLASLMRAFREHIITEDALRAELAERKYEPGDVDVMVDIEKLKIEAEEAAAVE